MPDFLLPDLGEGLAEAEVIAWRVEVGDRVKVDQIVAEVETAKAAVEVPIPFGGVVAALHAEPGMTVPVGAPLISVTADAPRDDGLWEPGVATPRVEEASGNVLVGYGTSPRPRRARPPVRRGSPRAPVGSLTPPVRVGSASGASLAPPTGQATAAAIRTAPVPVISPVVRKLARAAGLDLHLVSGTGPNGLIRRSDVEQALAAKRRSGVFTARPETVLALAPGETRIPFRGALKAAADKLARSRREIPEATVWVDADATGLLAARAALNARAPEQPVSLLALLARFALAGLRQYPKLNAHIDGDELVIPAHVNLGFAAQTERGLVVPVIRHAHLLTTRGLSSELEQRTAAARSGRLAPADLTGGTFTVNNYGVFGVDGSAAIINYPEVAILGMGRIIDRPWAVDGQVVVRKVTELTLAFDHRACDGGTAGGYLRYVADCVESPLLALGDL